MAVQPIVLNLPEIRYKQIQSVAEKARRPIDEILVEAASALAPVAHSNDQTLRTSLAQLAFLNDAALWQAARSTMPTEHQERLESLHDKQQRNGELSDAEKAEEQMLQKLYRETILVRAQAAVLLQQRNYDVSDPSQFHI